MYREREMYMYTYIHTYIYALYTVIHIYIYIYIEREREREMYMHWSGAVRGARHEPEHPELSEPRPVQELRIFGCAGTWCFRMWGFKLLVVDPSPYQL